MRYTWLFWLECAVVAVAYSPVVAALRKASSVVPVALLAVTMVPLDIALEARVRMTGGEAPWSYPPKVSWAAYPHCCASPSYGPSTV